LDRRTAARLWAEPRVRIWLVITGALLLLAIYFSIARIQEWKLDRDLVRSGISLQATVGVAGVGRGGYAIPPGTPVELTFDFRGEPQHVSVYLEDQTTPVTGQKINIRIDPDDPQRWTDLAEPRPLAGYLIGPALMVAIVPITLVTAWMIRRRFARTWAGGAVQAAVVVDRLQSAMAPMAQTIRCRFRDKPERRLLVVYLPRSFAKVQRGDVVWVLVPARTLRPALAAGWVA